MRNAKKQKGFTLVETIIYMAIISAVLTNFISYNLSISTMRNKVYSVQEVQANSRVAINLLNQKIREAEEIITPGKGLSSDSLVLRYNNSPDITFFLIGDQLYITEGAGDEIPITSNEVKISSLNFTNDSRENQKDNINITLDINYQADSVDFASSNYLSTSVSVRN